MKKLISLLLIFAMILALTPMVLASEEAVIEEAEEVVIDEAIEEVTGEPAEEPAEAPALDGAETYPLWVGGVQVTSANASNILGNSKASYNRATRTLTFNGLTGFTDYYVMRYASYNDYYGVYTTEDLTVAGTASFTISVTGGSYGIVSTGVLTVADGTDLTISVNNRALIGDEGVIINGGTINVTGRAGFGIRALGGQGLVVNGGVVNAKAGCYAIDVQDSRLIVNGGTVTATTTYAGGYTGIRLMSGTLTVNGGVLDVTSTADSKALDHSDHVTYASTHEITEGSLDGSHFRIEPRTITSVSISLTAPKAGASANPDGEPAAGSHFTIFEHDWCASQNTDDSAYSFEAGKTYYYYALLQPDDGYVFAGSPGNISNSVVDVKAGGQAAGSICRHEGYDEYGIFDMTGWISIFVPFTVPGSSGSEKPTLTFAADGKSAMVTGDWTGLYARVALVLDNNGVSGLYITQATINADGTILVPEFKVPGLKVKGVNVAFVPTLADIQSTTPNVVVTATKML